MGTTRVMAVSATTALVVGSAAGLAAAAPRAAGGHEFAAASQSAIAGAAPLHVKGAQRVGPARGAVRSFTLVLNQRHTSALEQRIADPHATPLSSAAFLSRYAPTSAEVAAVTRWAAAHQLRASTPANRSYVRLAG